MAEDKKTLDVEERMDLEAWFDLHGDAVAAAMFPDDAVPEDFEVAAIIKRPDRFVARITAGDTINLLKGFNADEMAGDVQTDRELALQLALKETDLAPRIHAYNQQDKWVLTEWIEGVMLERLVKEDNATDYAVELGSWFAEYTDVMQRHGGSNASDWFSYLQRYRKYVPRLDYTDHRSILENFPLRTRLIAKNDAYLGNFLLSDDGRLVGIDFEKAQLKPYGWDVLVTARVLVRKFPHMMLELTEAIVEGWGQGTDCIEQDEFLELSRIFASSSAFVVEENYAVRKAQADLSEQGAANAP